MKNKWVTGLVLGSLFFQVSSPMIGFAQETTELATTTNASIKKEDKPAQNSTNTSASKDNKEPSSSKPEDSSPIDTSNPLNVSPVPSGKPSDLEKQNSKNQEVTAQNLPSSAPIADEDLGPELFTNSKFANSGGVPIPGWSILRGAYSMGNTGQAWPPGNGADHQIMKTMTFSKGKDTIVYQDVSVTPGSTLSFGNFYTDALTNTAISKFFIVYAGPISNNLEDFSVVDKFTPPSGSNIWSRVKFVVPQGMTKMRIMIRGESKDPWQPDRFVGFSLKQDLNPPVNTAAPVINASDRRLALNATFDPLEGVTATDADDGPITLTAANVVHNDVDTSKEGTYSVTYSVTDSGGLTTRKTIAVTVGNANTPPVIHLPSPSPSVAQGSTFDPAPSKWKVTATDTEDGDLTNKIVVESNNVDTSKPGQYKVSYSVKDSGNLQTKVDMPVTVTPKPAGTIDLSVYDNGGAIYQVPQGENLQINGQVSDTGLQNFMVSVRLKGDPVGNNIDYNLFSNVPLGEKRDFSLSVPTDKLSVGKIYEYTVRAEDSVNPTKEQNITMIVTPPKPAHTLDLTVDKDTFDIEKGESVETTGEIWSNTATAMQSVSIKKKGEATPIDGTSFMSTPANQHNKYSLTIPADKLTVGENTFEVIGEDDQSTVSTKEITVNVSQPSDLIELKNGSFEKPLISGANRGQTFAEGTPDLEWRTTATDHNIELQNITSYGPAPDGQQWAELNANKPGALYQDIQTKPGTIVHWSVYHRGRDGEDIAKVKFGVPNGKMEEIQTMKTGKNWKEYSGVYKIPDGQTVTRFQFEAVSTSSGDNSMGNLLDHVVFTNEQIGEKPVIQAEDKTIAQNSTFDPLDGVSATDKEDGTVPVTVHENTVDTSTPGTYNVVYWATDSDKNTTEKTITVTVEPSELSFNVPDILTYDKQALSGDKEYAKRTDKNWQITIDNSKKVKWQVKAKAEEMVGETSHAKYKDALVYIDPSGTESSLSSEVLISQGDEQDIHPTINWQEDKGILFSVDPTSMRAENFKGTINWTLEQTPTP
uniref:Surface protein n=1 Tax=Enterococcus faecium TaxID=1352 RepID=A0A0D5MBB9_ENTFC|nr:immunoglobulin-like domain-containing protein [Enterococcus faecium]AJY53570.1 surface protein [Enterococcus faecium]